MLKICPIIKRTRDFVLTAEVNNFKLKDINNMQKFCKGDYELLEQLLEEYKNKYIIKSVAFGIQNIIFYDKNEIIEFLTKLNSQSKYKFHYTLNQINLYELACKKLNNDEDKLTIIHVKDFFPEFDAVQVYNVINMRMNSFGIINSISLRQNNVYFNSHLDASIFIENFESNLKEKAIAYLTSKELGN